MSAVELKSVGSAEAQAEFPHLLERVAAVEEIMITREGQPVARLVPVPSADVIKMRTEAIRRMREIASRTSLGGDTIRELIDEGRR